MIRAFAVLFFVFVGAAQAGTLTCGDLPCVDAAEQEVSWPKSELLGLALRTGPSIELQVPPGFIKLSHFRNSLAFFYPNESGEDAAIFLMTIEIPPGANNGPEGGWEELLVARNGVVEAYYYQDTQAPYPMFVAAVVV